MINTLLKLRGLLEHAREIQWEPGQVRSLVTHGTASAVGEVSDPVAAVALDERRWDVRLAVQRAERVLREVRTFDRVQLPYPTALQQDCRECCAELAEAIGAWETCPGDDMC